MLSLDKDSYEETGLQGVHLSILGEKNHEISEVLCLLWSSQVSLVVKNPPAKARDTGSIPGWGEIPWNSKWQPTPVFLPRESHGQRSLVGYSPWGQRVRHDWATKHICRWLTASLNKLVTFFLKNKKYVMHHNTISENLTLNSGLWGGAYVTVKG